jgi:hypothetical protein
VNDSPGFGGGNGGGGVAGLRLLQPADTMVNAAIRTAPTIRTVRRFVLGALMICALLRVVHCAGG